MKGKILISMIATGLLAASLSFADDTMGGNTAGGTGNDTGIAPDNSMNDNSNNNNGTSGNSGNQGGSMGSQGNDSSSSTPDNATGDDY